MHGENLKLNTLRFITFGRTPRDVRLARRRDI